MPRLSLSSQRESDRDRTPSVKRTASEMSESESESSGGSGDRESVSASTRKASKKKRGGSSSEKGKCDPSKYKWSNKDNAFFSRMRDELFAPLSDKQDEIQKSVDGIRTDMASISDRVKALEDREGEGYEKMKEELKAELMEEIDKKGDLGYQLHLQQEIARHAPNLIVVGLGGGEPRAALKALAKEMKIPQDRIDSIQFRKEYKLGKQQDNKKPPPICFQFGSIDDRQVFFDNAKNLPKDSEVYFDKDVPLVYRKQYKKYKQKAKKERDFLDRYTRIGFTGHVMQLKVRDKPEEGWVILHEYSPKQSYYKSIMTGKGNKAEGGEIPPRLNNKKVDSARKMIRVINYPEKEVTNLSEDVKKVIGSPLAKKVKNCYSKKRVATMICADAASAKEIKKALQKSAATLRGQKCFFECFDD